MRVQDFFHHQQNRGQRAHKIIPPLKRNQTHKRSGGAEYIYYKL